MKSKLLIGILLFSILTLSTWLRIGVPYDNIFDSDTVKFTDVDSYYHMRLADYSLENFPATLKHDSMISYPEGRDINIRTGMAWTIAAISKWTNWPIDTVGAYYPAVFGILLTIPVFVIGVLLFGPWAGLIGTCLAAIIPGELLARSSLGNTDHHVLEVFFTTLTVMFLVLAFKRNWKWSFGSGIALGLYNIFWLGSPLFTVILVLWIVIQSIVYFYQKNEKEFRNLCLIMTIALGLGTFISIWTIPQLFYSIAFCACILLPACLFLLYKIFKDKKPIHYPIAIISLGILALGAICLVDPSIAKEAIWNMFGTAGSSIDEVRPMTMGTLWAYFGICLWTGIAGWFVFFWNKDKNKAEYMLFIVWSAIFLVLMFLQRRFAYYAVVNMSLLSGYLCWLLIRKFSDKKLTKKEKKQGINPVNLAKGLLLGIVMIAFLFIPNVIKDARFQNSTTISNGWQEAITFIREKTPQEGYSVLSWWDYGYWIVREGERATACDPGGGFTGEVASVLTAFDNEKDNRMVKDVLDKCKVRYIIIDWQMIYGKFHAMPVYAGKTVKNPKDCLIFRLWNEEVSEEDYKLIFESRAKWNNKEPEVKIFEVTFQ